MVALKYLINIWGTLEMPLINCEINLITDTKPYVPVVNLSTQDNVKLLQQFKSCFVRTIN